MEKEKKELKSTLKHSLALLFNICTLWIVKGIVIGLKKLNTKLGDMIDKDF